MKGIGLVHWTPLCGPAPRARLKGLILIRDDGVRAVSTAGGSRVPLTLLVLILDGFCVAGNFLLSGGHLRSGERLGMGWEGFRKHAADLISPTAVVLDDL